MASREGDISLWLHNKLGSTDDLWSGNSICSQLSRDKLLSIQDCFHNLQPYVKVKLMLSFLHLAKRNVEEWKMELEEILQMAQDDTDQWVAMVGDILKTFPASGSLNTDIDDQHSFFHEVVTDLRKLVKKSHDTGMLPLECQYLNRLALSSVAGQQAPPVKHFALKRKPKSAALRAEILQKSVEAANNLKRTGGSSSVPVKFRSFAKKMDEMSPSKGRGSSTGFLKSSSLARSTFGGSHLGNRTASSRRDVGIKLLDIDEVPVGGREAKRRRKQAEQEAMELQKKEKEAQSNTPDYAAGLMSPAVGMVINPGSTAGPNYVPSANRLPTANAGGTTVLPTNNISMATQQARDQLQQQLQQQMGPQQLAQAQQQVQAQVQVQQQAQQQGQQQTTVVVPPAQIVMAVSQPAAVVAQTTAQPGAQSVTQPVAQPGAQPTTQPATQPGAQPATQPGAQPATQPGAQPPRRGLSLTREQMLEAQEMFKNSNKVTRPEKALILGFMAGARDNPCPQQGDIVNIRLSETLESVQQPDMMFRPMMIDTYFQMNYATGDWRRIKKYREPDPE